MYCPICQLSGIDVEMEHKKVWQDFHNPSDEYGHGQTESCILVCPTCGHQEECEDYYEKESRSELDL
jgi:uncharacterized Zn finger protein (UPF0148 family)